MRRHPTSWKARQLAAPALVLGLVSPYRRQVAIAYAGVLAVGTIQARREGAVAAARVPAVLAAMHLSWGVGLLVGAVGPNPTPPNGDDTSRASRDGART